MLEKLNKSKFRSSFHLDVDDVSYCLEKGSETIKRHARDFITQKIKPAYPSKDGSQTPVKGHPVFKAMHACACCCRGCLNKWYNVPKGVELSDSDCDKIVFLLMAWISREVNRGR